MAYRSSFMVAILVQVLFLFITAGSHIARSDAVQIFSVAEFGAVGDGKKDDTQAVLKAWKAACNTAKSASVVVFPPSKTFLVGPVTLNGPCKFAINVSIEGNVVAPRDIGVWPIPFWFSFVSITDFTLKGTGSLNGQGDAWWSKHTPRSKTPAAVTIKSSKNVGVQGVHFINSPEMHLVILSCDNVQIHGVTITAPGDSPNTDGIHIQDSTSVSVSNCVIATGDDCISITSTARGVDIRHIQCGPGHGVSIGSLGKNGDNALMDNIYVEDVTFIGSTNGARIKSWQGGRGHAHNITFKDLHLNNVYNPIIMNQYYCDQAASGSCRNESGAVAISLVNYINVRGTSAGKNAVQFLCSETTADPCTNIFMQDINIKLANLRAGDTVSWCVNAAGTTQGIIHPPPCFSSKSSTPLR